MGGFVLFVSPIKSLKESEAVCGLFSLGAPVSKPEDWTKHSNCGYDAPDNPDVEKLIEQNIKGEQCAISVYKSLLDLAVNKDPVIYNIVLQILQDEVEHEEDLQALQEDWEGMLRRSHK